MASELKTVTLWTPIQHPADRWPRGPVITQRVTPARHALITTEVMTKSFPGCHTLRLLCMTRCIIDQGSGSSVSVCWRWTSRLDHHSALWCVLHLMNSEINGQMLLTWPLLLAQFTSSYHKCGSALFYSPVPHTNYRNHNN